MFTGYYTAVHVIEAFAEGAVNGPSEGRAFLDNESAACRRPCCWQFALPMCRQVLNFGSVLRYAARGNYFLRVSASFALQAKGACNEKHVYRDDISGVSS